MPMKWTNLIVSCLVFILATASFAQQKAEPAKAEDKPAAETQAPAAKLAPMDKLQYRVQEDPALGNLVVGISSLGKAQFPVSVGFENVTVTVDAKGMTLDELSTAVKKELEAKYYKKATVTLALLDKYQKPGQAFFSGECKGVIQLPPGEEVTLSAALTKLGYSEFANLKKVEYYTMDKATGKKADVKILNMDAVINKGERGADKDPVIQDGDRVVVKMKLINF